MTHLFDTSIVVELAKCNLLDAVQKHWRIDRSKILILSELPSQLMKNENQRTKLPILDRPSLQRANSFVSGLNYVPRSDGDPIARQELIALQRKNDDVWHEARRVKVDGGEAQLFAATRTLKDFSVWTADKKSLIALSMWPNCQNVHTRLKGKVWCFERIMRELIPTYGFQNLATTLKTDHKAIASAFGEGSEKCAAMLLVAEQELQIACQGLLVT